MWRDRDNFINLAQNLCVFFLFLIQLNDSVAFACFEYDLFANWHSHICVTFAANFYSTSSTIMHVYMYMFVHLQIGQYLFGMFFFLPCFYIKLSPAIRWNQRKKEKIKCWCLINDLSTVIHSQFVSLKICILWIINRADFISCNWYQ